MQQATHPRLHVRDARDAHVVFEAVRQGLLRPVIRRLNEVERSMHVRSGSVFVWEECDDESGLKRWTDGRVWGQSRMREPYLFYDEKLPSDGGSPEQSQRYPNFRFVEGPTRVVHTSSALLHQDRSGGTHPGLIKQAYSAWVTLSPNAKPRKWHLTAYFTYSDLPSIPTIDRDPILSKITVPSGIYHGGKSRSKSEDDGVYNAPSSPNLATHHTSVHAPPTRSSTPLLPSFQATVGPYALNPRSAYPQTGSRMSEDHRVIHMLNSRHVT
ncbi:Gti1/Pac2 family-domain-containing protein [Lentinula raphanica]|uniref:Gti1/Pac2 family-domain-containing protein n=1 Tax=Lentinula raphanica TaxID=153919 RepID=A0AA38P238_9AGAR|nr:Gti1/Pac2 family-domain-containing protein [Lentinula raphanica]KAJ3760342.1 Gti1/Pac2 family-domain-containing protein [Lentinula raphanica]KAJ3773590.1 Gti1/Pac2 family-domain-containing protein [Lentinula raphanica]KAJ3824738.1 Gti1/Pac2 family-domain-containing protein [Lentinula raphanica]KAJ3834711.1 Gti1/Pac2 family-domain-containing protein [Lentinula raphanica]